MPTRSELFSRSKWGRRDVRHSMIPQRVARGNDSPTSVPPLPNILTQMLLRASNAVGYTNYPTTSCDLFVREAVQAGMDIFPCSMR